MIISAADAREAERGARVQRIWHAHLYLRGDETKAPSARDVMTIRRILAAAQERSSTVDDMISDRGVQALFDAGALWWARPGE